MDPNLIESERNLTIATKLLSAGDLIGAKRFAELAIDSSPTLPDDRPDQILAISDVLRSPQTNHYSVLQLPPLSSDPVLLKRHHRRLALLLHPGRNRFPGADSAFRLVTEAFAVLSDPAKKSLFDANLSSSSASDPSAFWTICNSCCHVHQYPRAHVNKTLKCPTCGKGFVASELPSPPPVVPGTDMYYSSWGFFPVGIGGDNGGGPFVPAAQNPFGGAPGARAPDSSNKNLNNNYSNNNNNNNQQQQQPPPPPQGGGGGGSGGTVGRNKKKPARKKVMSGLKNRTFGMRSFGVRGEEEEEGKEDEVVEEEVRGININEAAKGPEDGAMGTEDIDMIIDLDTTDDMLGNLQNLPFLKDEGINIEIPYGRAGGV